MAKGLLDLLFDSIFDENWVGRRGEKLTENELKFVQFMGRKGKVLKNVYIPKEDGTTTEIDLLFITQKGIFVIESKNYSGWIFGDENSYNWTVVLPNKEKIKFYNPIKQNKSHIKYLKEYLNMNIPFYSFVVFSERCTLKKVTFDPSNIQVFKRDYTYARVRQIWNENEDCLTENQINEIVDKLNNRTNVEKEVKEKHIQIIKEQKDLCPYCHSKLVLRIAKATGKQFYGCSSFPKCRYTRNI